VREWVRQAPLFVALLVFAALSFTAQLFNDADTGWHLATGQWIAEHRAFLREDPFSFTMRGHHWTAHEWLTDLAMAGAFALAGWAGLALLFGLAAGLTFALIARELLRWLEPRHVVALFALLVLILAPFMLARPHVIAWPLLAIWTTAMLRARERGRAPPLYWAALILLWANLHASYIVALGLAAAFALEALVEQRDRRMTVVREWGLFGLLSAIAALGTPHGVNAVLYPFQASGLESLALVQEWRRTSLPTDWAFFLLAAGALAAVVLRWRQVGPVRLLLLLALAGLAFTHARHQPQFAIVASLILAPPLAARDRPADVGISRTIGLGLLAAILFIAAVRLAIPLERRDAPSYPITAISKVPPELRGQPVFNSYGFGGPLILHGIAPFIDGRADMYGDAFTFMHDRIEKGDRAGFEATARKWDLRWTILEPGSALVRVVDKTPGWRRHYADRWAVVHVRDDGKQAQR
jgi:hypothetical protein